MQNDRTLYLNLPLSFNARTSPFKARIGTRVNYPDTSSGEQELSEIGERASRGRGLCEAGGDHMQTMTPISGRAWVCVSVRQGSLVSARPSLYWANPGAIGRRWFLKEFHSSGALYALHPQPPTGTMHGVVSISLNTVQHASDTVLRRFASSTLSSSQLQLLKITPRSSNPVLMRKGSILNHLKSPDPVGW